MEEWKDGSKNVFHRKTPLLLGLDIAIFMSMFIDINKELK